MYKPNKNTPNHVPHFDCEDDDEGGAIAGAVILVGVVALAVLALLSALIK